MCKHRYLVIDEDADPYYIDNEKDAIEASEYYHVYDLETFTRIGDVDECYRKIRAWSTQ